MPNHINNNVCILLVCLFFVFLFVCPRFVFADPENDELTIKRDKEKTVYTIGSSDKDKKNQSEEDKKNSWDMLKNMNLWIKK